MNSLAQNVVSSNNIFDDTDWLEAVAGKPAGPIKLPDDPIALGCASYRLAQAGQGQYHELDKLTPEPEDRQQAQNIRNYYRSKITWELLKKTQLQQPLSSFRQKLMGIIENTYTITPNDLGILYRIPYFYVEDCEHDAIFEGLPEIDVAGNRAVNVESTFTFIRKVRIVRKAYDNTQYWFSMHNTFVPAMTVIGKDNTLRPLFESVVSRGPIQLRANWYPKILWNSQYQHRWYYQLAQIELA